MDYFIECAEIECFVCEAKLDVLYEASNKKNLSKQAKNQIANESNNLLTRMINKIKVVIAKFKKWINDIKVKHAIKTLKKNPDAKTKMKVPKGETANSFGAKIDLMLNKMKAKMLNSDDVEKMRTRLAQGTIITVSAATAVSIIKKLAGSIPIADKFVKDYDAKNMKNFNDKQQNRVSHADNLKNNGGEMKSVPGVIAIASDVVGSIVNKLEKKPKAYNDLDRNERVKANNTIKEDVRVKAARAKDKVDQYKKAIADIPEDTHAYKLMQARLDNAKSELDNYTNIYRKRAK